MSVDAVTEALDLRRRSILTVLGVVVAFLPIAALTAESAVERAAYPAAVVPFLVLFVLGKTRRIAQAWVEWGLLLAGSALLTVLFAGQLGMARSVEEVVATATSFGARNSLMLAAGAFLLLGARRGLVCSLAVLAAWTLVIVTAAADVGAIGELLGHAPMVARSSVSTVVTLAVLWALTSQNEVWSTGEAVARRQAEHDPLTGLANRRRVLDALQSVLVSPARRVVVAMVDIDHFKLVNDTHGHDAGDAALTAVARTLREHVRDGDLVARWGGEEFVVVLTGVPIEEAVEIAERCRVAVAAARPEAGAPWFPPVTVSIGLTRRRPDDTPTDLLRRADEQLYRAKEAGRDCVRHAAVQDVRIRRIARRPVRSQPAAEDGAPVPR